MSRHGPASATDRATVRAFTESLRIAFEVIPQIDAEFERAGVALSELARQCGKSAALAAAFDAQPRHRELPSPATVQDWLDRHVGPDPHLFEYDEVPPDPPEVVSAYLDRVITASGGRPARLVLDAQAAADETRTAPYGLTYGMHWTGGVGG